MSRFSQTIGSITLAGLTFLAGCRKAAEPDRAVLAQGKGLPPDPASLKVTPLVGDTNQLAALQVPSLEFGALGQKPTAIRSTNSPQYKALKFHLDVVEKWITAEVDGGARVLSKATRRSPANDNAVRSLKFILNDFNSLIKDLYTGQRPWRALNTESPFNDSGATEAMVGRTEELLGLPRSKRYGRTVHFALTEALREAYGLEPRLHTVLKRSVLKDNESLLGSPNCDPYSRYPALKRFCSEPTRRIIEPPSTTPHGQQRDVAVVIEIQHCLIKMGYNFDFPKLRQTGIRDNATDEALKRFEKEFIRSGKPMLPDPSLVHQLVSISTGFDFLFGATLNHEYRGVPFSMDPIKTYCGMTWPTLRDWCDERKIAPPNNMFDIKREMLAACYREVFVLPSGTQHLLYYSGGPLRTNALMLAHLNTDAAFNRNPALALDMREKALGIPDKPTRESMEQMLRMNPAAVIERLVFERARVVGYNDRYEDGLINRLKNMAPYLPAIKPERLAQVVDAGFHAGQKQREAENKRRAPAEKTRVAEKSQKAPGKAAAKGNASGPSKRVQHTTDKPKRHGAG